MWDEEQCPHGIMGLEHGFKLYISAKQGGKRNA